MVTGWKLDRAQRDTLLARWPPKYRRAVADHVTLRANVPATARPPGPAAACIVGRTDDGKGVEALIVEIDGSIARPDGGTFHITWSLGDGRKAKESNDAIRDCGFERWPEVVELRLEPASFG